VAYRADLVDGRRERVADLIPPRKCSGRTTKGLPCKNSAYVGAVVCRKHGAGAPQVKAAADRRVVMAEMLVDGGPRRPAWEILLDVMHAADVLMKVAREKVALGETLTVADMEAFTAALERAQRFAKTVLDAGVDERQTRVAEALTARLTGFVDRAMASVGLPSAVQGRLRKAIAAEVVADRANTH